LAGNPFAGRLLVDGDRLVDVEISQGGAAAAARGCDR